MKIEVFNDSWKDILQVEFQKEYFKKIRSFLISEKEKGKIIYPPDSLIFNAFRQTPFDKIKVVIIGQDPYHGKDQAMGLSFSVSKTCKVPPSLKNIFKELHTDLGTPISKHGDLSDWAKQGVFLLNSIITVEAAKPSSHKKIGWENFTTSIINSINVQLSGIVFLLWGNFAKKKKILIDTSKHFVLEACHPSPLARGGFFGCQHFSKTNKILESQGKKPIDWNIDKSPQINLFN